MYYTRPPCLRSIIYFCLSLAHRRKSELEKVRARERDSVARESRDGDRYRGKERQMHGIGGTACVWYSGTYT